MSRFAIDDAELEHMLGDAPANIFILFAAEDSSGVDRAPNEFEKKVDFDAVERDLERIEADARASISDAVEGVRDTFIAFFQRKFDGNSSFINELKEFRKMPKVRQAIGAFLRDAFDSGRAAVRGEMKDAIEFAEDPNVVPKDALRRLRTREFWVTGIIEDDLLAESRNILLRAIETGEPARATELKLKEAFQPFIGDPSIVNDKGVVSSARLDTIIRTNTTDAYNRGRIVEARQAGPLLQAFEYSAILDSRTTAVCRHLDGKVFRSDDPDVDRLTPPRHFNCRSLLVPVTIGEPVDKFASKAEVGEGLELSGKGFK